MALLARNSLEGKLYEVRDDPQATCLGKDDHGGSVEEGQAMSQPALRDDQIKRLYYLKQQHRLPMTKLLRQIVDTYLEASPIELKQLVREAEGNIRRKR